MSEPKRSRVTDRSTLLAYTDRLLLAARDYSSPHHALLTFPGTPGGYGTAVDGLEGFARTFLAVGFRTAGERGADPHGYLERYAAGVAAGTDPHHPERWTRPSEHGQAKVEAASLALVLDLTRPWLWASLDRVVQEQIVDYLAEVVGDRSYPRNNWLWFRITVETFLRSVGGPHRLGDIADDLERFDSYYERDGWYRDGDPVTRWWRPTCQSSASWWHSRTGCEPARAGWPPSPMPAPGASPASVATRGTCCIAGRWRRGNLMSRPTPPLPAPTRCSIWTRHLRRPASAASSAHSGMRTGEQPAQLRDPWRSRCGCRPPKCW